MGVAVTYVREGAVVDGFAAHVLDRLLARYLPAVLAGLPAWARAEVEATRDEIRRAARAYESLPVAAVGSAELPPGEVAPQWTPGDEGMSTGAAADFLGVSSRRARQLAAAGLGRKVGGVWVLDRSSVLAERDRRAG